MAAFENPNPGTFLFTLNWTYEFIFLISLISNFLVEYQDEGMSRPVRDISKICWRYLKGQFLFDFIPLVPLQLITMKDGKERLFILIKIIRLVNGFKVFQVRNLMEVIKNFYQKKLETIIENDPVLAEDIEVDNNCISILITLNNLFRILKLVIIILNISYFLGFAWFILTDLLTEYDTIEMEQTMANLSLLGYQRWE